MTTATNTTFRLTHVFHAPKEKVFKAFSTAEALNAWWGPAETSNSVIKLDFRPGGIFHFKMESDGNVSYGRFLFVKIEPYDLLEFTNAFADEQANVVKAPFDIEIPKEIFYQLRFEEAAGKTTIILTGRPVNASDAETAAFISIKDGMEQGFGGTFNKLANYLAQ